MDFRTCLESNKNILMEGATALSNLWNEYIDIAQKYHLPFIATTPTRRVNCECILKSNKTEQVILDNVSFLRAIERNSGIEMYVGGLM